MGFTFSPFDQKIKPVFTTAEVQTEIEKDDMAI
jgi:hypothetical protein